MGFNLESWKTQIADYFKSHAPLIKQAGADTLYGLLAAGALLPAIGAYQGGEVFPVMMALSELLGSVGGNLISNLIQKWKDKTDAEIAQEVLGSAQKDAEFRQAVDVLLKELDVVSSAQQALSDADKQWFIETLQSELKKVGSGITISVGNLSNISNSQINIVGNQTNIQADTYIAEQINYAVSGVSTDPQSLRQAYLSQVYETARTLQLAGIDPKAASESKSNLNLAAVYTGLLTQTPEEHELREQQARPERPDREARKLSALEQLNRHNRLVLLGDPGSGKTTFVNFVALCLAGEALGNPESNLKLLTTPLPQSEDAARRDEKPAPQPWDYGALLPVRVILRDFAARGLPPVGEQATARHLWDFIAAELKAAGLEEFTPHLRKELQEQGGLLLVDGLDEVPEAEQRRVQIKQAVEQFARSFPKCRLLVTSRIYAYQKQEWQLNDFSVTTLAPFIPEQIRHFIDRWYAHIAVVRQQNLEDARGRAELLKREVFRNDRLLGLAERPLLLTLMASLHAWRGGNLPEKREALYADTVNLLLDWWESPKTVRDGRGQPVVQQPALAEWLRVDRDRVRELIEELAYEAHRSQPNLTGTADISQSRLVEGLMQLTQNPDVKPARLIEYLSNRAGLLLPRGVGVFTFPHRTFQEYLAACYLTRHMEPEEIAALACADVDRWREVTLLAAARATEGMSTGFWAIVDNLCPEALPPDCSEDARLWGTHLAGQALVESINLDRVSERNRQKANRVRDGLLTIVQQGKLPPRERALAGNHLGLLGDPRFRSDAFYLPDEPLLGFVHIPAGRFIMGSDKKKDPQAYDDEQPQHEVELGAYYIARYPVTVAQFKSFVEASKYKPGDPASLRGLLNHPVVNVTWYDALAYCDWLTTQLPKLPNLPAELHRSWRVTLPSEAEWERAARGTDGRIYPWGNEFDPNKANVDVTGIGGTSAVGCFPAGVSPEGLLDASGNVWEWTRSLWGKDSSEPEFTYPYSDRLQERENLKAGREIRRVLRGGSWGYVSWLARCASRSWISPGLRSYNWGFRVSLSPL
ncbi:MAG TPA: SUMF1/EgtB/PvdO family nonheme iron enzyme [Anaerolineaceae bacterium]|nr:SUMF1/EgtB/PvdO family nonheme iron enzyme [Anaerolineaceae bacterium]HQH87053.1 SUMF1/EgtB/PvdO family nonheme iron enzyme [Anaerolineaceae bacterium]